MSKSGICRMVAYALLLGGPLAQAMPYDEPGGTATAVASVRLSLPADATVLNTSLAAYAYQHQPAAEAQTRTQALAQYLTGLGYRHTWQMVVGGEIYDAWYSESSQISVLCAMQRGDSVSMSVLAMTGKIRRNEMQVN